MYSIALCKKKKTRSHEVPGGGLIMKRDQQEERLR